MKHSIFLTGLVAGAALAVAGLAQAAGTGITAQVDMARAQQIRAQMQAQTNQAKAAAQKTSVAGAKPGNVKPAELFANPDRAYPPSCLNAPMPLGMWQSDPNVITKQIWLIGDPYAGGAEASYLEQATVHLFRVACSGGKSATLLEIDRPSNASTTFYPTLPAISVAQGSNNIYIRLADDPNTFFSTNYSLNPLTASDVFALENFYNGSVQLDYNQAFTLTVDNLNSSDANEITTFPMATYNPSQYAAASQPLPISGYLTGAWYDPNHSGEGIQVEVGEQGTPGAANDRYIVMAWYTYDASGVPYWLYGEGSFTSGDRQASVTMVYSTGGGFAGSFGSANTPTWGTVNVQFPDCNTMQFNYQSASGLPTGVPTGNGAKTWTRISQINGLTCQ
jgi:hypothetical protein